MVRVEHYGTPIWKTIGKPCRTTIAGWWWLEPWMDYDVRIPFRKGNLLENPKWRFAIFFRGVDVSPPTSHRWVPMTSSRSSGWDRSDDGSKISPCADMIGPIGQRLRKELSIQKLLTYIYIYIYYYILHYTWTWTYIYWPLLTRCGGWFTSCYLNRKGTIRVPWAVGLAPCRDLRTWWPLVSGHVESCRSSPHQAMANLSGNRGLTNPYDHWIGLRENLNRKPWFLPSKIELSCKFSHHPILWYEDSWGFSPTAYRKSHEKYEKC